MRLQYNTSVCLIFEVRHVGIWVCICRPLFALSAAVFVLFMQLLLQLSMRAGVVLQPVYECR